MSDDVAEIPATDLNFALWFFRLRLDAESDPNLTEPSRAAILEQFDIVNRAIVTLNQLCAASLLQTEADRTLQAVAEGLHAAIRVGAYYPDASGTAPTRAANKKRMRKTQAGRRRDDIQGIIERLARTLWARWRSFRRNDEGTAKKIYDKVVAEIRALPKAPRGWEVEGVDDQKARKRYVEKIRKRVARIEKPDD